MSGQGFTRRDVPGVRLTLAYRSISLAAGIAAIGGGAAVLLAWLSDVQVLNGLLPGPATMKFNTALCFVLCGVGLCAANAKSVTATANRLVAAAGVAVAVIAGLSFIEYVTPLDFGIDELVVADTAGASSSEPAGRMSVGTAISFIAIAVALLTLDVGRAVTPIGHHLAWSEAAGVTALALGAAALIGYIFGVDAMYRFAIFSSMAWQTALLFVVLAVGILLARPDRSIVAAVVSDGFGGHLIRTTLPAMVLVPLGLGWLSLQGQTIGLYGSEIGFALFALGSMALLSTLVIVVARSLDRMRERVARGDAARARLASIVEFSNDSIASTTLDGIITSWNQGAERLFGYTAAEAIGQPLSLLVPPHRQNEENRILSRIRRGELVDHFETERRRKDGGIIDISLTVSPIKSIEGEIIGASKIARDVTDRKRAEFMFRATFESAPTAMIIVDPSGSICLINSLTEAMFGYRRGELLGRSIETLVPLRHRAGHPRLRDGFVAAPSERMMGQGRDLHGLRHDGSEFPVEVALCPIRTPDGLHILSAIVDITERKRAEDELRNRTEELARSNHDLEQFAYVASHDLQEPLRAVAGCVQLLQKHYEGRLDDKAEEFMGHAVEGANRMRWLIDDLLAYSRIGRNEGPPQQTDSARILQLALYNLRAMIDETGARITHDDLPTFNANPAQLVLLFQNLIGNAIKFRRDGEVPSVHVHAEQTGDAFQFSIRDNGIGIDPEYFERVFVIFQRLHSRSEYPGTGIGLALCKRIVEQHGGRIWVESNAGAGATFCFTLGRLTTAAAGSGEVEEEPSDGRIAASS